MDQVVDGASLESQRALLTEEASRRGWDLEVIADEGLSAKSMRRPGLQSLMDRLDRGDGDTLLAVRLDRVSRSVADFAGLLDRAQRKGWGVVLLSPALDLADPAGRFTAHVVAAAAEYERALIAVRTREGMAQRKAEGWVRADGSQGRPAGRERAVATDVVDRIQSARTGGVGWAAIARQLTDEGVPTARGGARWYPSTVQWVAMSRARVDRRRSLD